MPSTYTVNLGIQKPATGEQSGTWGNTTNANFDILDQGINGAIRLTLTSAGSSGSPNALAINEGSVSDGHNKWIEFYSSSNLGGNVFVQLTPNDAEKIVFIRNSLAGSRSVLLFQGTYNSGRDLEIPAGVDMVVKFSGGGANAATVTDVYTKLRATEITTPSLTATTADINGGTIDNSVIGGSTAAAVTGTAIVANTSLNIAGDGATVTGIKDEDNMASNSATKLATQQSIKAYVDSQVGTVDTLSEILANGNTTSGTDIAVSANDDITFTDSSKAIFGSGSDLQIFHDASNSYIKEAGTGNLFIDATSLRLRTGAGTETYLTADGNGSVALYNNNVKKLETKTGGIDVLGNAKFSGAGNRRIEIANTSLADTGEIVSLSYDNSANFAIQGRNSASTLVARWYEIQTTDTDGRADAHVFYTDLNAERMSIDATGIDVTGTVTANDVNITDTTPNLRFEDTDGNHLANFTQSGSHLYIDNDSTGNIRMRVDGNTEVLTVNSSGIDVTGDIDLIDNGKLLLGSSDDLQIFHSGGASWIKDEGTGQLNITTNGTDIRLATNTSEKMLVAKPNQSVELYYDNTKVFETSASGIDVTGVTKTSGSGYDPSNTGWATNAALITSGSYGGGLTFIDGNKGYSFHTLSGGDVLTIKQGATSGALTEKLRIDQTKLKVTGDLQTTGNVTVSGTVDGRDVATDGSKLDGIATGADVTLDEISAGTDITISAGGVISSTGGGITNVVDDTSPELGGNLTLNSHDIVGTGNIDITGLSTTSTGYQFGTQDSYLYQSATDVVTLRVGGTGSYRYFQFTDTGGASRIGTASGTLILGIGTNNYLNIGPAGDVSIPSGNLNVAGEVTLDTRLTVENTSGYGTLEVGGSSGGYIDLKGPMSDDHDLRIISYGTNNQINSASGNLTIQRSGSTKLTVNTTGIDVTGNVEFDGLSGTGSVTVTDILDEDNMASNSATKLATQQSIKSYVDTQVATIPSGDITGVTAGTGLTGGGTSGAVTLNLGTAGAGAGTYGSTSNGVKIDNITLDAYGRVTAVTTGSTGDILSVTAGTGLTGGGTSGDVTVNIDSEMVPATATPLSSSVDLNDLDGLSDAGFYYQTANANTPGNNYPDNRAGSLIIQKSATGVTQHYQTYHPTTPDLYFRSYYGGWSAWRKVWTDGNDGAGSGLDADTLDGAQGASYLRSDADDAVNAYTTQINFPSNTSGASTSADQSSLQVYQSTNGGDAFMTFHVSGDFATYFGIDGTTNDLFVGGWSNGANKYKIWHAGNDGAGSGLDADTLDGINGANYLRSNTNDTFTGTLTMAGQLQMNGNIINDVEDIYLRDKLIHDADTDTYIGFTSNTINFNTGGSQRLRINNSSVTVNGVLSVGGAIDLADDKILRFGSSDDAEFFHNGSHMYTDLNTGDWYIRDGTTTKFLFNDNGDFHAEANIFAYSTSVGSDRKLKDNIELIESPLEKIQKLNGVTFNWKRDGEASAGVIAQDVQKVLPSAVKEVKQLNGEGEDATRLNVDYNQIIGLLVESVKELKKEIEELKKGK